MATVTPCGAKILDRPSSWSASYARRKDFIDTAAIQIHNLKLPTICDDAFSYRGQVTNLVQYKTSSGMIRAMLRDWNE